jgi:predicted nucleotidyltransferase
MKSKPDVSGLGLKPEVLHMLNRIFDAYEGIESVEVYGSRAKGTYHDP